MKDNYVIIADGLTKKFGTFTATDRISFRVKEGEIFGFLGPMVPARLPPCVCFAD